MNFAELLAPLSEEKFWACYQQGGCCHIKGTPGRFSNLVTLDEIELRLNDGCNFQSPVQVIGSGNRHTLIDQNLPWSPTALRKSEVLKLMKERNSFLMMNMSQINPKVAALIDTIEAAFSEDKVQADMHLYVSTAADATSFDAHRDFPQHKLFMQAVGTTHWQVFQAKQTISADVRSIPAEEEDSKLELVKEFELHAGDVFYMPPGVFHKVRNYDGPRISLSIPFAKIHNPELPKMDRTYIPFKELFEQSQK